MAYGALDIEKESDGTLCISLDLTEKKINITCDILQLTGGIIGTHILVILVIIVNLQYVM